jgi:putative FmdB family regulatory protein
MPIYEYRCASCEHRFEKLVRGEAQPSCPRCASAALPTAATRLNKASAAWRRKEGKEIEEEKMPWFMVRLVSLLHS